MFSAGMPILNWIAFLALTAIYWSDKYMVLRDYKKPPLFDGRLNRRILYILPFAVWAHCLLAFYMYGSEDIFPTGFHKNADGHVVGDDEHEWDRLTRLSSGVPYILLFILCVLIMFFNVLITAFIKSKLKKRSRRLQHAEDENAKEDRSFTTMKPKIKAHGLYSYKIEKNK